MSVAELSPYVRFLAGVNEQNDGFYRPAQAALITLIPTERLRLWRRRGHLDGILGAVSRDTESGWAEYSGEQVAQMALLNHVTACGIEARLAARLAGAPYIRELLGHDFSRRLDENGEPQDDLAVIVRFETGTEDDWGKPGSFGMGQNIFDNNPYSERGTPLFWQLPFFVVNFSELQRRILERFAGLNNPVRF